MEHTATKSTVHMHRDAPQRNSHSIVCCHRVCFESSRVRGELFHCKLSQVAHFVLTKDRQSCFNARSWESQCRWPITVSETSTVISLGSPNGIRIEELVSARTQSSDSTLASTTLDASFHGRIYKVDRECDSRCVQQWLPQ
jgi:hypothetical protein